MFRNVNPQGYALLVLAAVLAPGRPALPAGPADLKAFYREGQTFLTWAEDPSVKGERYRVYRSDRPITADNVDHADLIAILLEGSCRIRQPIANLNPAKPAEAHPDFVTFTNCIIQDVDKGGKPLPDGTGLLVWTVKKPGQRYYAVVSEMNGKPTSAPAPGQTSLTEPIDEKVEVPGAVKVIELPPAGWYYFHWMDYATWNPRLVDDCFTGYGFLFHVAVPDNKKLWAKPLPVVVRAHGRGAVRGSATQDRTRDVISIRPKDFYSSWFYGHSDALTWFGPDKFNVRTPADKGTVVDFFWRRLDHVLRWVQKRPANLAGVQADGNRIHWIGFSMGGTGGNTVAIRHGDVFASVTADKGLTNWRKANSPGTAQWQNSVWRFWGKPDAHLKTSQGEDVYDRMNTPKWLAEHPEAEIPYMAVVYGRVDPSISFQAAPEYAAALQKGRHPFTFAWNMSGHMPTWGTGAKNAPQDQPRNETLPAFSNATCNTPLADVPFFGGRFRLYHGTFSKLTPKTMTAVIEKTPKGFHGFAGDLAGKYLGIKLYPYAPGGPTFRIASNTADTITIADGDLTAAHFADVREKVKTFVVCHDRPDGTINSKLEWSSSANNVDPKGTADDIVDEPGRWEMSVRLATYRRKSQEYAPDDPDATCTVDITPRRCQRFHVAPGERIAWQNVSYADPAAPRRIAGGVVTVDRFGLVTVEKLQVGKKGLGNRLCLKRPD